MNNNITTTTDILNVSRKILLEEDITNFNMRNIAKRLDVSVGAIYNYYPSKDDLLTKTVSSIFMEILDPIKDVKVSKFIDYVDLVFETVKSGNNKYPGLLSVHQAFFIGVNKKDAIKNMNQNFELIRTNYESLIKKDKTIRKEAFKNISSTKLASYIFDLTLKALSKGESKEDLLAFINNYFYSC